MVRITKPHVLRPGNSGRNSQSLKVPKASYGFARRADAAIEANHPGQSRPDNPPRRADRECVGEEGDPLLHRHPSDQEVAVSKDIQQCHIASAVPITLSYTRAMVSSSGMDLATTSIDSSP